MKHPLSTTNHTFLRFCTFFVALVLSGVTVASALQTNILLQGKIVDEKTGQPVIAKYAITGGAGKTLKGKSLADGSFKQILQAGESYTITFNEYNVIKSTTTFAIPATDKYYEEKKDFAVRVLHTGDMLLSLDAFDSGKPSLTTSARTELEKIVTMLKENRGLDVQMTVAADVPPKAAKAAPKKAKKGKKAEPEETPVADSSPSLVQARIDAVRAHLEQVDASAAKRVNFISSPTPNDNVNLVVTIGEVKNKFE
jgi:archaellum component FlaF (FlaF/FlaG flagellin family)